VQQPSHVFQPQVVEQSILGKRTSIGQIELEKTAFTVEDKKENQAINLI